MSIGGFLIALVLAWLAMSFLDRQYDNYATERKKLEETWRRLRL